jgi:DNA-binding GntR family transcriptional regulator
MDDLASPPAVLFVGGRLGDRRPVTEQIVDRLKLQMDRGLMAPGQRLIQRDLADELGVSTTPVREALHQLSAQGLVEIDPNRGAAIPYRSAQEIREIYEIRKSLEVLAAVKATAKLKPADYQSLHGMQESIRNAPDSATRSQRNHEFHMALCGAADMPRLVELISQMRNTVACYVNAVYAEPLLSAHAIKDHEDILEACERADIPALTRAVEKHLDDTARIAIAAAERHLWIGAFPTT